MRGRFVFFIPSLSVFLCSLLKESLGYIQNHFFGEKKIVRVYHCKQQLYNYDIICFDFTFAFFIFFALADIVAVTVI